MKISIKQLAKIINEDVIEYSWLDKEIELAEVIYSNWDSQELKAIVAKGVAIFKGISQVLNYIKEHGLLVLEQNSLYMPSDWVTFYSIPEDEVRQCVVNCQGKVIIPPIYTCITLDGEDNVFVAEKNGEEKRIDLKKINY